MGLRGKRRRNMEILTRRDGNSAVKLAALNVDRGAWKSGIVTNSVIEITISIGASGRLR